MFMMSDMAKPPPMPSPTDLARAYLDLDWGRSRLAMMGYYPVVNARARQLISLF